MGYGLRTTMSKQYPFCAISPTSSKASDFCIFALLGSAQILAWRVKSHLKGAMNVQEAGLCASLVPSPKRRPPSGKGLLLISTIAGAISGDDDADNDLGLRPAHLELGTPDGGNKVFVAWCKCRAVLGWRR